jgi:2-dehydropantoate 2-reductase
MMPRPRSDKLIAVVGAGAVGGYVGGHLARAGCNVVLIDQWAEHVDQIKRAGMRFGGTVGDYDVPARALHVHETQQLVSTPVDIAFICVKLYDTEWATALIKPYLAPGGYVVTMQNGLVEEVVAGMVGWGRTVGAIASTLSTDLVGPGHIIRTRVPGGTSYTVFRIGEVHGRISRRVEELVAMLNAVDSAKATSNLWGERWSKLVANSMTSGLSGVTGLSLKAILQDTSTRSLVIKLGSEAIAIGIAGGFSLEPVLGLKPEAWIAAANGDGDARAALNRGIDAERARMTDLSFSGTAQDLRKGRRTEVDYMNGFVARVGDEINLPAITHKRIADLLRRIERGQASPQPGLIASLL